MGPEKMKFELEQPSTLTLTLLYPVVLLPMVKPLMVIQIDDSALIPLPEMLKITEFEEIELNDTDN